MDRTLVDPDALAAKADDDALPVIEPATGERLTAVRAAGAADVRAAVREAANAQRHWALAAPAERAEVLRKAALTLAEAEAEATQWLVREGGAVRGKAKAEIGAVLDELWAAAALPLQAHGELLPAVSGEVSIGRRLPLGVVGVISPWNFPMLLGLRAVAPALALGNAVVLKPDPHTPVSGGVFPAAVFAEAGLPPGVLQVVCGDAEPGEALVDHPDVPMIAFTGSTAVGRRIGEAGGRALKRVSLELGGNNALIVLDDADLEAAAAAGAWGAFTHQGQVCMTAGRHIVLESVADRYLDLLAARAEAMVVGDPWADDSVHLGPLIDDRQARRVHDIVQASVAAGATVLAGGTVSGRYHRPTVLAGVTPEMPAFTEEIFGPVAPVIVVRDEDEAVEAANATDYGLVAGVLTGSTARGLAVAERLRTGIVHVNDQTVNDNAHVPFGGRGASGNGSRYGARHSWDEFTQWQWLTARSTPPRYFG
jgi:benzaldehyde dehydrogenase (NAD)